MENKKSNNVAVCITCGVLTAFGIVADIISLVNGSNNIWMIKDVVNIIVSCLIGFYAFCAYRKPKGNLLKYIILIFAANRMVSLYLVARMADASRAVINAIIIGLCCYIAGRMHRVMQNAILMSIVTVLIVICIIYGFSKGQITIGVFTSLIIWLDICVAYILRYKEHKLAGLMDKTEK